MQEASTQDLPLHAAGPDQFPVSRAATTRRLKQPMELDRDNSSDADLCGKEVDTLTHKVNIADAEAAQVNKGDSLSKCDAGVGPHQELHGVESSITD